MANKVVDIGDQVRSTVTFTLDGVSTDPTTIVRKIKDPAGTETTVTVPDASVTKASDGVYYSDIVATMAGTYYVRWNGTGTVVAAAESSFVVRQSAFTTP